MSCHVIFPCVPQELPRYRLPFSSTRVQGDPLSLLPGYTGVTGYPIWLQQPVENPSVWAPWGGSWGLWGPHGAPWGLHLPPWAPLGPRGLRPHYRYSRLY